MFKLYTNLIKFMLVSSYPKRVPSNFVTLNFFVTNQHLPISEQGLRIFLTLITLNLNN